LSTLCTQPSPFYVFRSIATGVPTWMDLLELCENRIAGVHLKLKPYERATLGLRRCDLGICLRDKSMVMSALQVAYKNGATLT